jgi:hypothetical protein
MVMSDQVKDLYLQHLAGRDKYTYFLLAAAGSALAFAVQKTDARTLTWSMVPLALAGLSWALSFYFGCKNVSWVQSVLYANLSLLQLKGGVHPRQPDNPDLGAAVSGVNEALGRNAERAAFCAKWQVRFLVWGAILFLGWHVLEMYLRTRGR